jgi:hypothetical protein
MSKLRNILNRRDKYTVTTLTDISSLFFVKSSLKLTGWILSVSFESTYILLAKETCKKDELEGFKEFIKVDKDVDFLLIVSSLAFEEFNPKNHVGNLIKDIKNKFVIEVQTEKGEVKKFRVDERDKIIKFFREISDKT